MKFILAALLGLFTVSASAQTYVYKLKMIVLRSGAGANARHLYTGYAVNNLETGDFVFIRGHTASKTISIIKPQDWQSGVVQGAKLANSIVEIDGAETLTGLRIKGKGGGKTYKLLGLDLFTTSTPGFFSDEFSGSLSYDAKTTAALNTEGLTPAQIVERLTAFLLAKGYLPE